MNTLDQVEPVSKGTTVKVQATYTCMLCGTRILYGDAFEYPYDDLPGLLGQCLKNQLFAGNPYLHTVPMNIPHKCTKGLNAVSAGLAYFAGFIQVVA